MPRKAKTKLDKQADEILRLVEDTGTEQSYFFTTTFARYTQQLKMLAELEKVLASEEVLVTKTYVKGRENVYANPAIAQYNSTADAANRTVATLMKIITTFSSDEPEHDALMEFVNRGRR